MLPMLANPKQEITMSKPQSNQKPQDKKSNPPPPQAVTKEKETPMQTTPTPPAERKLAVKEQTPEEKLAATEKAAELAATEKAKADAAAAKPEKPKVEKFSMAIGTPKGSKVQEVRKGCAIHLLYVMLDKPAAEAMTVEQMAAELHRVDPNRPLASQTTNVRVEIASFRSIRGMHVGRDAQGRYSFNITEQVRTKVLTEEQQKEKAAKDEAKAKLKVERLAKLDADRKEKAAAKQKAKEEAAAKKAADKLAADQKAAAEKEAAAKLTPEQVAAELAKQGVKGTVVS